MKSDARVIEALNNVLLGELTAVNQYFLHARMCKSWGYDKLADVVYKHSIGEMKHASELTDRILFLEGIPNLQKLGKLNIGETVAEQMKSDLALEVDAIAGLKKSIAACEAAGDRVSQQMLEAILVDEEGHIDWVEIQIKLINSIGLENYLSKQIS